MTAAEPLGQLSKHEDAPSAVSERSITPLSVDLKSPFYSAKHVHSSILSHSASPTSSHVRFHTGLCQLLDPRCLDMMPVLTQKHHVPDLPNLPSCDQPCLQCLANEGGQAAFLEIRSGSWLGDGVHI